MIAIDILFKQSVAKKRIPIDLILKKLSSGDAYVNILESYLLLKENDNLVCARIYKIANKLP